MAQVVASAVIVCFVIWNLGLAYQWGEHLIPARGSVSFRQVAYNQFFVVPVQLSGHLQSYVFHRHQLMQQIEQKDMEQLKRNAEP